LKKLGEENKSLREQIGAKVVTQDLILASVIGADSIFTNSQLVLDKGKDDGVKEGSLVILKDILIGQIISIGSSTSTVRLLNDPETKIPAITEGGAKGIVEGEFGTRITLTNVLQNVDLKPGQFVFTSGEADFPKGLVLGRVVNVDKNPAELFQSASVESLVKFGSLDFIFIIK
jgi:rod shape-determining protein MreC